MKKIVLALVLLGLLSACKEKDSVPAVDDPHSIVVDGAAMSQMDFLKKYCADKTGHPTCDKVKRASVEDSSSKSNVSRF